MATASIIIIGNEILSGKTQDVNVQFLANELAKLGIHLREVRIIADVEQDIIETVNLLRRKYDYVFTTGGIGPTHDDITSSSIAKAFKQKIVINIDAKNQIEEYLNSIGKTMSADHLAMARIPESAELLLNYATGAPGFKIDNVFVMAGVPYIMQAIFEQSKKFIKQEIPILIKSIETDIPEGILARDFAQLQEKYPEIEMGSYPFKDINNFWRTTLSIRGSNMALIDKAMVELELILDNIKNYDVSRK